MCYCEPGEGPRVFRETNPTARKKHLCCECGSEIDPGEKYWRVSGLWDDWQTFKTCEVCQKIKEMAYKKYDCIAFECLYETIGSEFEGCMKC